MVEKKIIPIDYTSRDFNSIKRDLLTYVKRYYPDNYKDYSQASFGSMVLDSVAYVGDMLSFYVDYNANESFIGSALEYDNIVNIARQMGFKYEETIQSYGYIELMVSIPSKTSENAPDLTYIPKLLKGSIFSTTGGTTFTLTQDVDFLDENTDIIGSTLSADGTRAEFYTLKVKGHVVSGQIYTSVVPVGSFRRFLSVEIPGQNIGEIVSVVDSEGHEYQEVDYLSQNTVFKPIKNTGKYKKSVPHILKSFPVPRRFIVERSKGRAQIIFGYGSENDIKKNNVSDPSDVAIKMHGKNHVASNVFDPSKLTSTEKFGVTPVDTNLTIKYRINNVENVNASSNSLTEVIDAKLYFSNERNLTVSKVEAVRQSVAVNNDEPINGFTTSLTTEEIKRKAFDTYAMQGRAVTKQDYVSAVYAMPAKFGSIKRCAIYRDTDDLRRNINLYVISESADLSLERTNSAIKENLRNWLNNVRMITDTIDILDTTIINLGIDYDILVEDETSKYDTLVKCQQKIQEDLLQIYPEIGEPFYLTEVLKSLKDVPGVLDVVDVRLINKTGLNYSEFNYNIEKNMSLDGRKLEIPINCIWEVKFPNSDVRGTLK